MSRLWSSSVLLFTICGVTLQNTCSASVLTSKAVDDANFDTVSQQFFGEYTQANTKAKCNILAAQFPGKVSQPADVTHSANLLTYYSQEEQQVHPACIVTPTSSADVSAIVNIIREHDARFAIRSGGHTLNAGAANIEGGVTISLQGLRSITSNVAGTQVSIGPGLKWAEVYAHLDIIGLSVPGGRNGDVGVGGLITGGRHSMILCLDILAY
jgi:hypothetical protein